MEAAVISGNLALVDFLYKSPQAATLSPSPLLPSPVVGGGPPSFLPPPPPPSLNGLSVGQIRRTNRRRAISLYDKIFSRLLLLPLPQNNIIPFFRSAKYVEAAFLSGKVEMVEFMAKRGYLAKPFTTLAYLHLVLPFLPPPPLPPPLPPHLPPPPALLPAPPPPPPLPPLLHFF